MTRAAETERGEPLFLIGNTIRKGNKCKLKYTKQHTINLSYIVLVSIATNTRRLAPPSTNVFQVSVPIIYIHNPFLHITLLSMDCWHKITKTWTSLSTRFKHHRKSSQSSLSLPFFIILNISKSFLFYHLHRWSSWWCRSILCRLWRNQCRFAQASRWCANVRLQRCSGHVEHVERKFATWPNANGSSQKKLQQR